MIRELGSKGDGASEGPKKRRRSTSKRKRSATDAPGATGE